LLILSKKQRLVSQFMKKLALLLLTFLFTFPSVSQNNPNFFNWEIGGYGSPELRMTAVNGDFALLMGGRGGLIINHKWVIGGGGWSIINNLKLDQNSQNPTQLNMKYRGIFLAYFFSPEDPVHFGLDLLLGEGKASTKGINSNREISLDRFFVIEPGASLILTVSQYVRISLGANYRFISQASLENFGNSNLSGTALTGTIKFGLF